MWTIYLEVFTVETELFFYNSNLVFDYKMYEKSQIQKKQLLFFNLDFYYKNRLFAWKVTFNKSFKKEVTQIFKETV